MHAKSRLEQHEQHERLLRPPAMVDGAMTLEGIDAGIECFLPFELFFRIFSKMPKWKRWMPLPQDVHFLKTRFEENPVPSMSQIKQYSECLNASQRRIRVWFQNQRQRRKQMGGHPNLQRAIIARQHASVSEVTAQEVRIIPHAEMAHLSIPPEMDAALTNMHHSLVQMHLIFAASTASNFGAIETVNI